MRVGIIGAGNMAVALGGRWAAAGHEVLVGGRSTTRSARTAGVIGRGTRSGSPRDAAVFGDAVLLAVRRTGVTEALAATEGRLAGRTLIDCTNPLDEAAGFRLVTADGPSHARLVAERVPGAHVVKAFNLLSADLWAGVGLDGTPGLDVPVATDSEAAADATGELVRALGCTPLRWGPLERAGQLEAVAAFGIRLIVEGRHFDAVMPTVQPGPPPGSGR